MHTGTTCSNPSRDSPTCSRNPRGSAAGLRLHAPGRQPSKNVKPKGRDHIIRFLGLSRRRHPHAGLEPEVRGSAGEGCDPPGTPGVPQLWLRPSRLCLRLHTASPCVCFPLAVTRTLAHQVRPISHLQSLHGIGSPKTLPQRQHAPRFQKWGVDIFFGGTTFNPVIRLTPWRGPKLQTGLRGSSPRQTLAEAQRGGLGSTPQTHCVPEAGGFVARPGWAGPLSPEHDASGGRQEQLCGVCPTTWGRSCASREPLTSAERLYFLLPVSTLLTSLEALWGDR